LNSFSSPQGSTTYEQRYAIWKRDQYKSGSGITGLQLQTGHIVPAEWGGKPEPENLITQTFEENMERAAAQKFRQNLPWRLTQEERFIGEAQIASAEKIEATAAKRDKWGRAMNAAQLEKEQYEVRKSYNLKLYTRQINRLNTEIRWLEKEIYNEEKAAEDKTAKGIKDSFSEAQTKAMMNLLVKYTTQRDELTGLKGVEEAKEFELPAQVTEGERFRGMNIGRWDEYAVRHGKGPELAKEEDILGMVSLDDLTLAREVVQGAPWAVDYRGLSIYSQQGAELMWTATEKYRDVQAAAEPLVKELFNESLGRPSEAVPKSPATVESAPKRYGQMVKETMERGEAPIEAGPGAGECRTIDYEDPEFIAAVQNILLETLSEGVMTD
jgi:hypothetical protein